VNVRVFSTPTCPWCKKAKEFLQQNNVEFKDLDVAADTDARNEMMEKSGQMGVPVIDIDGQIILGYDVEKMKQALNLT